MSAATRFSDCRELFAVLSQYLDAELPQGDCAEIEKHIASCPPCVDFVNSLRQSIALCREVQPGGPALPELSTQVRDQLRAAFLRAKADGLP